MENEKSSQILMDCGCGPERGAGCSAWTIRLAFRTSWENVHLPGNRSFNEDYINTDYIGKEPSVSGPAMSLEASAGDEVETRLWAEVGQGTDKAQNAPTLALDGVKGGSDLVWYPLECRDGSHSKTHGCMFSSIHSQLHTFLS